MGTLARAKHASNTRLKHAQGEGKGRERKGKEGREYTPPPPTFEEVEEYRKSKDYKTCSRKFFSYYEQYNWRSSSGNKITNWKVKFDYWEFKDFPPEIESKQKTDRICKNDLKHTDLGITEDSFLSWIAPLEITIDQTNQQATIDCENEFILNHIESGHQQGIDKNNLQKALKVKNINLAKRQRVA
jgi:hypothetical protein